VQAERNAAGKPVLVRLMPTISMTISVTTEPAGAQVYLKRFSPDAPGGLPARQLAGTTPLTNLRVARGQYVLSVEKEGFAAFGIDFRWSPTCVSETPPPSRDTDAVRADKSLGHGTSWGHHACRVVEADGVSRRYSSAVRVTNRGKEFISAGSYRRRSSEARRDQGLPGTVLEEAMDAFTDRAEHRASELVRLRRGRKNGSSVADIT
jgi:hypothetical protein